MAETTTVNWEKTYLLAFKSTKETKLREFQFKLLHRRIATKDDLCTFCGEETENLFESVNTQNPFGKYFLNG